MDQNDEKRRVICCFELTDEEIEKLKETKQIWYSQMTFGHPMHPMLMSVDRDDVMIVIEKPIDNPEPDAEPTTETQS